MNSTAYRSLFVVLLLYSFRVTSQTLNQGLDFYRQSLDKSIPFQSSVEAGEKALVYALKAGDDELKNLSNIQLGILYWNDGQFDKSLTHLDKARNLSRKKNDYHSVAKCAHYKGLVHYYQCNFDSALHWYSEAGRVFSQLKNDSALAKLKSHKALIYSATGSYRLAIQNMLESFKMQESLPGYRDMTIPIQFFTPSEESLYYKSKLEKDIESLRFVEQTNDKEKIAFTQYNIGLDYLNLKTYNLALQFFKKSSSLYASLNYFTFTGSIGEAYVGMAKYDSAIYFYNLWVDEVRARGTKIYLSAAYGKIAACYRIQKKWKEALYYFDLANDLNRKIGLRRVVAAINQAQAEILIGQGQYTTALGKINSGIEIVQQIGCIKDLQSLLKLKSQVLLKQQQYELAARALELSLTLQDSIRAGEGQLQVAHLQIEYETEKKSRDLAELQSLNKLKEAEIVSRNLQIALAFSLLTIVTIAGGFFYCRYRQKKKSSEILFRQNEQIELQNEVLWSQNKEKEVLLSEIHHRVKNNLQIISSLINLKSTLASAETTEALQQLNGRIFSMGLIHEKLYQTESIQVIRLDQYLREIGRYLVESFSDATIQFDVQGDPVEIDADQALSCGLICNELMINSLKYAFADSQNYKSIKLDIRKNEDLIDISISDNGAKQLQIPEIKKSFGLRFVDQLVSSKLKGIWTQWHNCGFHVNIQIPFHTKAINSEVKTNSIETPI